MVRVEVKNAVSARSATETKEAMCYYKLCKMERIVTIHIPNEGRRSKAGGGILKAMGMTRGTPDFYHPIMRGGYGSLWLEMKRNKKYTRSEKLKPSWVAQEMVIEMLRDHGHMAEFAYGWQHAKQIRDHYLSLQIPSLAASQRANESVVTI